MRFLFTLLLLGTLAPIHSLTYICFTDQRTVRWPSAELSVIHGSTFLAVLVLLELHLSCLKRMELWLHCLYVEPTALPTSVLVSIVELFRGSNTIWAKEMILIYAYRWGRALWTHNMLRFTFCKRHMMCMRAGGSETWYQDVAAGDGFIRAETGGIEKGWSRWWEYIAAQVTGDRFWKMWECCGDLEGHMIHTLVDGPAQMEVEPADVWSISGAPGVLLWLYL